MGIAAIAIALALFVSVAACGGEIGGDASPGTVSGSSPSSAAPIPGGGLSIGEALASTLEGPLQVKGFVVSSGDGEVRLCSTLLESMPPQCGEPSLQVSGVDLSTLDGLSTAQDLTWSDAPVSLLGRVENGVITVSATAT